MTVSCLLTGLSTRSAFSGLLSPLASCMAMGQSVPSLRFTSRPGDSRGWSRWSLPPLPVSAISGSREGQPGHSVEPEHETVDRSLR